jgi:predicted nucleic acid-binding protein
MRVVSDTTAITTLLKTGREQLLFDLLGQVIVPQAVWDELRAFHAQLPDFILRRPVAEAGRRLPETRSLGRGEAEAIQLAKEINADLLLTDDLAARSAAVRLNVKCSGLLGLMVRAKESGHIGSLREAVEALETRGGLYLSDAVKAEALKLAGETS